MATISQRGTPRPDRSPALEELDGPGVYMISCPEQNIGYVGSARILRNRYTQHWAHFARGVHAVRELQAIYDELGVDALEFKVLARLDGTVDAFDKELLAIEGEWIASLSRTMTITNLNKRDDHPVILTGRLTPAYRSREYIIARPHLIDEQIECWQRLKRSLTDGPSK